MLRKKIGRYEGFNFRNGCDKRLEEGRLGAGARWFR